MAMVGRGWAVLVWLAAPYCLAAGAEDLQPEAGEELLGETAAALVLEEVARRFQEQPCVRAKIVSEVDDDLLGPRKEEGELLMRRPGLVLRRFFQKGQPWKAWRMEEALTSEYNPALNKVVERDFSKAPKSLELLRAAITTEVAVLKQYFQVSVFRKAATGSSPSELRLVLTRREDRATPLPWKQVVACLPEGAAFFSSVEQIPIPGQANRVKERYTEVQVLKNLDRAGLEDPLLQKEPKVREQVQDWKEQP